MILVTLKKQTGNQSNIGLEYSIVGIEYTATLNEISPNERSLIQKGDKTLYVRYLSLN
jgi:hypothetical protein